MSSQFSPGSIDADGDLGKYEASPKPLPPNELGFVFVSVTGAVFGPFDTVHDANIWRNKRGMIGKIENLWRAT